MALLEIPVQQLTVWGLPGLAHSHLHHCAPDGTRVATHCMNTTVLCNVYYVDPSWTHWKVVLYIQLIADLSKNNKYDNHGVNLMQIISTSQLICNRTEHSKTVMTFILYHILKCNGMYPVSYVKTELHDVYFSYILTIITSKLNSLYTLRYSGVHISEATQQAMKHYNYKIGTHSSAHSKPVIFFYQGMLLNWAVSFMIEVM